MEQTISSSRRIGQLERRVAHSQPIHALWYVLLGVVCAAWFSFDLAKLSLWTDEWFTLFHSGSFREAIADPWHPPLYYVVLWVWRTIVPLHELITTRVFSLLCLVVTLLIWTHMWQRELGDNPLVPGLALGLCLISPYILLYGRMGRHFAFASTLVAVAAWCLTILERKHSWRVIVATVVSHMALALEDYWFFAVVMGTECVYVGCYRRTLLKPIGLAVSAGVAVLLAAKFFLNLEQAAVVNTEGMAVSWKAEALAMAFPLVSLTMGETFSRVLLILAVPAVLAWLCVAVRLAVGSRPSPFPKIVTLGLVNLGVLWLGCATMILFGKNIDHLRFQTPKLFFPFAPLLYMVAAYVLGTLFQGAARWALVLAMAGVMVLGTINYHRGEGFVHPVYNMPWREAVQRVMAETSAVDAVFSVDRAFGNLYSMMGGRASMVVLGPDMSMVRDRKYKHIWLVTRPIPHARYAGYFAVVEEAMKGNYREAQSIDLGEEGPALMWFRRTFTGYAFEHRVTLRRFERIDS